MDNQKKATPKSTPVKIIIVVMAVLLVLSAGGLAARYIYLTYLASSQATVTVPDNLIGEKESSGTKSEESAALIQSDGSGDSSALSDKSAGQSDTGQNTAAKLELYQGRVNANEKFEVRSMLPGDSMTKYFCVKAYHNADITLFFQTEVTDQTKNLGDVLHIKVTHLETGKELCNAPFTEVNGEEVSELLKKNAHGESTAYYRIDISLAASVGNEYQSARLTADFNWYVKDEGGLTPPQTGDIMNLVPWAVLSLSAFLLILLLLVTKRRKEDDRHE